MAVIKLGPMISDIRGSIGGTTFARNRAGIFARQRVKPVDDPSERKTAVRTGMLALQDYWRDTLTAAERATWEAQGTIQGAQGALGDKIRLTGAQAFIRTNMLMHLTGHALVDAAPTLPFGTSLPELTFTSEATTGVILTYVNPPNATQDNAALQIQVSPVFSLTRNYYKGPWPLIHFIHLATQPPQTLTTGQPYKVGDRFFLAMRFVDKVGRFTGTIYKTIDIVADS